MPDCHRKLFQYHYSGNNITLLKPCLRIDCKTCRLSLNKRCLREIVSPIWPDVKQQLVPGGRTAGKTELIRMEQLSEEAMQTEVTESVQQEEGRSLSRRPRFRKRIVLRFQNKRPEFIEWAKNRRKVGVGRDVRLHFRNRRTCFAALVARLSKERTEKAQKTRCHRIEESDDR
ncbi:hypothetical protein EV356DRAFT_512599 [Viridothelium virens]|uniref:Uncharacterized protein n=1 Tax=Viridothelium virens TaxID=1048519 RepID=A0A6A6HFF5_VIRVR|nr:hypothetical protein EV356DRAFT_512599 [Viridothelium virens]